MHSLSLRTVSPLSSIFPGSPDKLVAVKKKFLLANKHITKLNSTLSVRIEELNAQLSSLYVENLRLRASEIALAAQLKREREKSRKILAEAETATLTLTKHLGFIRQSFNIPSGAPSPVSPPSPRARKPPSNPNPPSSPHTNRISRPPNVPGIHEDEEPCASSSEQDTGKPPSPALRKTKTKPRLSASRLPLPSRASSPPPLLPLSTGTETEPTPITKTQRPSRRQSGMLAVKTDALSVPRVPSPAFGSPIRREAALAEEEDEIAVVTGQLTLADAEEDMEIIEVKPPPKRRKSRGKEREQPPEDREEAPPPVPRRRTKERVEEDTDGGGKPRLQDVTNSRPALIPIDHNAQDQVDHGAFSAGRAFLRTSPTPTSRSSQSPVPPGDAEGSTGGRERRTRKSVNYAEPKLNTYVLHLTIVADYLTKPETPNRKMRKPDPQPGSAPTPAPKKRSSAAAVLSTYRPPDEAGNEADNDTEARSSLEMPLRGSTPLHPESFPLPPSRASSAASMYMPPSSSSSSSSSSAATSVRRKKSRPQMVFNEDEESDGAQADAEYGVGSGWVNLEGRRRAAVGGGKRNIVVLEDRRHSMAV
ncbi:hypothetical protein H0H81_005443 [Sphagnurus paluster]|uniref:Shugoshin C-terminal domain-containing protein n=1 Tax=Sphagnurus paluster TaxID=117069 RepID=A0A9P7K6W8_9AGAR|nr:hypothetical protein H0H81_005443 [Sphagnurus paluster]